MKKNPRIYLKKPQNVIKNPDIQNVKKRSKTNLKSMLPVLAHQN